MAGEKMPASMEVGGMDAPANYIQVGFLLISVPNALLIIGMVLIFIAALLAPFPGHHEVEEVEDDGSE